MKKEIRKNYKNYKFVVVKQEKDSIRNPLKSSDNSQMIWNYVTFDKKYDFGNSVINYDELNHFISNELTNISLKGLNTLQNNSESLENYFVTLSIKSNYIFKMIYCYDEHLMRFSDSPFKSKTKHKFIGIAYASKEMIVDLFSETGQLSSYVLSKAKNEIFREEFNMIISWFLNDIYNIFLLNDDKEIIDSNFTMSKNKNVIIFIDPKTGKKVNSLLTSTNISFWDISEQITSICKFSLDEDQEIFLSRESLSKLSNYQLIER